MSGSALAVTEEKITQTCLLKRSISASKFFHSLFFFLQFTLFWFIKNVTLLLVIIDYKLAAFTI